MRTPHTPPDTSKSNHGSPDVRREHPFLAYARKAFGALLVSAASLTTVGCGVHESHASMHQLALDIMNKLGDDSGVKVLPQYWCLQVPCESLNVMQGGQKIASITVETDGSFVLHHGDTHQTCGTADGLVTNLRGVISSSVPHTESSK